MTDKIVCSGGNLDVNSKKSDQNGVIHWDLTMNNQWNIKEIRKGLKIIPGIKWKGKMIRIFEN